MFQVTIRYKPPSELNQFCSLSTLASFFLTRPFSIDFGIFNAFDA
jgi:hypothetical protein